MQNILMCGTEPIGQVSMFTEQSAIATVVTNPTTVSISNGSHFMLDGVRYKATANISAGGNIQVGTNCVVESVEENFGEFKHIEYYSTSATFNKGFATVTHNLGKPNQVIPIASNGLCAYMITSITNNSFDIRGFVITANENPDVPVSSNYSGTLNVQYFLVY